MFELLIENLTETLAMAIAGVIAGAIVLLARQAMAYLQARMGVENFQLLRDFATMTVRFIEQSSQWDTALREGMAKKERALIELEVWSRERGIPFDRALADRMIEEAVNVMRSEFAEVAPIEDDDASDLG